MLQTSYAPIKGKQQRDGRTGTGLAAVAQGQGGVGREGVKGSAGTGLQGQDPSGHYHAAWAGVRRTRLQAWKLLRVNLTRSHHKENSL